MNKEGLMTAELIGVEVYCTDSLEHISIYSVRAMSSRIDLPPTLLS